MFKEFKDGCVNSYIPYILTMFSSFRLSVANSLGFETFVEESLDDHSMMYAFLIPDGVSQQLANKVRDFLQVCFSNAGFLVDSVGFFEEGMYNYNWCGSRHLTVNLGKHWLFEVQSGTPTSLPLPPNPSCDPWVVVAISYDSVKPEGSCMRFDTTEMTAATPENYLTTYNALKSHAIQFISNIMGK